MGADPATWVAIVPAGGRAIRLAGRVEPLRNMTGAEIWVSGFGEHDAFQISRFEVRRVNGREVDDGVVVVNGERVSLRSSAGTTRDVPNAPTALRGMSGARIWITRPAGNQAPSYGVIETARP
jgi:hypothetical protein